MDETQPPSAQLGRFVAELTAAAIPDRALRLAERCFLDTIGVTLAGAETGAGRRAIAFAEAGGEGTTTIPGVARRAPEGAALLATGTAGHGLDYDDVSWGMDGHPSVTLVAPALAVGEALDATGQQLLTAFVAGFETECYLASAISPGHYERGWHATGTFGVFGAAAVACKLLDADAATTQQALAIAASGAAGIKRNFGSMTKPLHVGGAVQTGVRAARLAIAGFSADPAAIGGERGFWDLYAGPEGVGSPAPLAPDRWALLDEGVHVKSYPCCYFTHTSIANAIALAEQHELRPADVEGIEVVAGRGVRAGGAGEPGRPAGSRPCALPCQPRVGLRRPRGDDAGRDGDRRVSAHAVRPAGDTRVTAGPGDAPRQVRPLCPAGPARADGRREQSVVGRAPRAGLDTGAAGDAAAWATMTHHNS
jgi:2-methylcitrate dehydratase PrpD